MPSNISHFIRDTVKIARRHGNSVFLIISSLFIVLIMLWQIPSDIRFQKRLRKKEQDPLLAEAYKLGMYSMTDPHRIYSWAISHQVNLKAERKRLKRPGVLEYCIFTDSSIEQGEEYMALPQS